MSSKGRQVPQVQGKPKLLWVGDLACHTGFGVVSENVLTNLQKSWDVCGLGVNYMGDPHNLPFPIYPASLGGDVYGINRLESLLVNIKPDVVCILNDPWIVKEYLPTIKKVQEQYPLKAVAYIPIDSPNVRKDFAEPLNKLDLVIGYNNFGVSEMKKAGLNVNTKIIPHGVDTKSFFPLGISKARALAKIPEDWYIVGCVARNQERKRLDLMIQYFAEWSKDKPNNVRFYYHGALKDLGWDIVQLCNYLGMEDRLVITAPNLSPAQGVTKETLNIIYNCFNVHALTTKG